MRTNGRFITVVRDLPGCEPPLPVIIAVGRELVCIHKSRLSLSCVCSAHSVAAVGPLSFLSPFVAREA